MKELTVECTCNFKGCTTTLRIEQDEEQKGNLLLRIRDDKHDVDSWISIDKDTWAKIEKFVLSKYGRK
jgi:hypothetical protein